MAVGLCIYVLVVWGIIINTKDVGLVWMYITPHDNSNTLCIDDCYICLVYSGAGWWVRSFCCQNVAFVDIRDWSKETGTGEVKWFQSNKAISMATTSMATLYDLLLAQSWHEMVTCKELGCV